MCAMSTPRSSSVVASLAHRASRAPARWRLPHSPPRAPGHALPARFEPRFFWIPGLRMYALLALTAVDLGLSGRTPPTIGLAALRCAAVVAIMLIFTVAVLAPCPYHRIDRWNIAKRIALLVLQNIGSGTTLALTLVELDGECSLYTVTYSANRAHNLTRSP